MKKPLLAIVCAVTCAASLSVEAQTPAPAPTATAATGAADPAALAKLRERIRTDLMGLVAQNLPLTDAEAKAFWPVYERCRASIEAAQRKGNLAIVDYVGSEGRLTDAHAKQIVEDVLAADADAVRARKSCFERVAKVLPGKKAARYFQIENKVAALARYDAAAALPLAQ